jgi:hypothetical protein
MSLTTIDRSDYGAFKVAVSIGGRVHQHYIPTRANGVPFSKRKLEAALREAKALEGRLKVRQAEVARKRHIRARPSSRRIPELNTGVRGISICIKAKKSGRKVFTNPSFVIYSAHCRGRSVSIKRHGFDAAWRRACEILADAEGLSAARLKRRKPTQTILLALQRREQQQGS